MATPPLERKKLEEAVRAFEQAGTISSAARLLGLNRITYRTRLMNARAQGITGGPVIEFPELPPEVGSAKEIIEQRLKYFARKKTAKDARNLIPITVHDNGPIGIVHMGDPHLDDDGCNLALLTHHIDVVKRTPGLYGGNVGDMTNNWIGRLARLYAHQHTTPAEAMVLLEWFVREIDWLYLVGGNHDVWSGDADPLRWIAGQAGLNYQWHGARLALNFPNGRSVRVHVRHQWAGNSMWNPAHGPSKAAQRGWRDHILVGGHKHIAGWAMNIDPMSRMISHSIQVGSYKVIDSYAEEKGFDDHNIPACVTIINPRADREEDVVIPFWSVDLAADFLTFLRKKK